MTYLVLALKWRPQRFDEVAGQEHVSRTLSSAIKTGRSAHAYLFTGPRGVGKTTMARIMAKALNCERGPAEEPCNECRACREVASGRAMDVFEIDGASNRGIDDIRELREAVRYAPATLTRKVYIIDEVHMLTQDAFNALLKTLEEPPAHVVFVLATTEPLKVPQTILSRCQRFDFARLGPRVAQQRLRLICDREGIQADDDALFLIARKGEGSMRDALTLLDQVLAGGPDRLTLAGVRTALGVTGRELFFEWTEAIKERDPARALRSLGAALDAGANMLELAEEFLWHLRNLLFIATDAGLAELVEATEDEIEAYKLQAKGMPPADLLRCCRLGLEMTAMMRRSGFPRAHLEVALAEMCLLPGAIELRRFIEATRGRLDAAGDSAGMARVETSGAPAESRTSDPSRLPRETRAPSASPSPREAPSNTRRSRETTPKAGETHAPADSRTPPDAGPAETESIPTAGDPWSRVLAELSGRKAALAAILATSTMAGEEDRMLRVRVPGLSTFQKGQLEKATTRQLLKELVSQIFGRPLGVRFEEAPGGEAVRTPEPAPHAPVASPDGVRRIVDLFGGEVIGPA